MSFNILSFVGVAVVVRGFCFVYCLFVCLYICMCCLFVCPFPNTVVSLKWRLSSKGVTYLSLLRVVVVVVMCCSVFVVVAVVVCWALLFVVSNPRLSFTI